MERRRKYTKEFKESSVELYRSSGKTLHEVGTDLGINPENLRRWIRESQEGKTKNIRVFPGQGNPRDEELYRLRKEVADLRETSDFSVT
jgi:transposase